MQVVDGDDDVDIVLTIPTTGSCNSVNIKEMANLGALIKLPFKLVFWIIKKIVIGIPIMIGKSILTALLMALLPLIVVVAAIYWFITTQI